MWLGQNTGYLIVYFYAESVRVQTSIILQIVYLTLAMVGYCILETQQRWKRSELPSMPMKTVIVIDSKSY